MAVFIVPEAIPSMSAASTDNRPTVLVFVILAAVALLLVRSDWLVVALGSYFPVYWAAVLVWLVCIALAIRRQRRWWHPPATALVAVAHRVRGALSRSPGGGSAGRRLAKGLHFLSADFRSA
ncbi:hypothetical protein [Achromobacter xylosoxidans]|uniref:hypothetical protein n=1 Tax=Alcaligenes xylosoxydans xylosoxydans TaxID=85698 RepID=UPI000A4B1C58|nr:hypothetical protein [Achromobacter xylosoxidans]